MSIPKGKLNETKKRVVLILFFRDQLCVATSKRLNEDRRVSGSTAIAPKLRSIRPDILHLQVTEVILNFRFPFKVFKSFQKCYNRICEPDHKKDVILKNDVEFGVAESGKKDAAAIGKKEIVESQLLIPKTMADMFAHASNKMENSEEAIRRLKVIGFSQTSKHRSLTKKLLLMLLIRLPDATIRNGLPKRLCAPLNAEQGVRGS